MTRLDPKVHSDVRDGDLNAPQHIMIDCPKLKDVVLSQSLSGPLCNI